MLQITEHAAMAIADACNAQEVAESGGLRIATRTTVHNGSAKSLVVEFVDRPRPSDTCIRAGSATVFLADGVEHLVESRVLDAEADGTPPRFVLRARGAPPDRTG